MELSGTALLVGAIVVVFCALFFVARNTIIKRKLICPRDGTVADVEVVRRHDPPAKPVRVRSCTQFEDPTEVDCDEACIKTKDRW